MLDPEESLGYQCSLTFRAFQAALEARFKAAGFGPAQLVALAHLIAAGKLSQAELAARLGVSAPAAHGLVARMAREGWLRLGALRTDRRVNLVAPTPKARRAWEELSPTLRALLDEAYHGIPEAELRLAHAVLKRVRENLARTRPRPREERP